MKYFLILYIFIFPYFLSAQIGIGIIQINKYSNEKQKYPFELKKNINYTTTQQNVVTVPAYKEAFFCTIENRIAKKRKLGFDFGVE